ncbi:MAG: hypothetical protein H0W18_05380 [Acidobacteria bacterium]|nr:hypothetical protein [Acidobacteriota bacterium]
MTSQTSPRRTRVVCLEGPSAVGKTTLAAELARTSGALIVPELDASGAPAVAESARWFVDRHASQWQRARTLALKAALVVLDGDPFKGLWYNWVYAADGWPRVDVVAPLYRSHLAQGTVDFPDLYVVLAASEAQLRQRGADDLTRTRRTFESHLRLVGPLQRYFEALAAADPERVLMLDTSAPDALAAAVLTSLERLPPGALDGERLFEVMVTWVGAHDPARKAFL